MDEKDAKFHWFEFVIGIVLGVGIIAGIDVGWRDGALRTQGVERARIEIASGQVVGHLVENADKTTEWYFTREDGTDVNVPQSRGGK
jgi:hypothetical protein